MIVVIVGGGKLVDRAQFRLSLERWDQIGSGQVGLLQEFQGYTIQEMYHHLHAPLLVWYLDHDQLNRYGYAKYEDL